MPLPPPVTKKVPQSALPVLPQVPIPEHLPFQNRQHLAQIGLPVLANLGSADIPSRR